MSSQASLLATSPSTLHSIKRGPHASASPVLESRADPPGRETSRTIRTSAEPEGAGTNLAAKSSESNVVTAMRNAGYTVEQIEFRPQEDAVPGSSERVMVAYVERPLTGYRMEEIERRAILETLNACGGNQAQAARMLGISEKTVYNKLRTYRRRGLDLGN